MPIKACCSECFADHLLRKQAEELAGGERLESKCLRCASPGKGFDPRLLRPQFEVLLDTYQEVKIGSQGHPLHHLLQEDWMIFKDGPIAENLVYEILPETRGKEYICCSTDKDYPLMWEHLKEEIKKEYRYCFSQHLFSETSQVASVLQQLGVTLKKGEKWFRCRISEEKLGAKDMGAPPPTKASAGRANPVGISYLYLAEDEKTAITEVRPHKGVTVFVGNFEVSEDLFCVDLTDPIRRISPFGVDENLTVEELRSILLFFKLASFDLSMPISPEVAPVNYIPTQVLCEFIKKSGYAGVIYKSAYTNQRNLVVFNPPKLKIRGKPVPHEVTGFEISHSPKVRKR